MKDSKPSLFASIRNRFKADDLSNLDQSDYDLLLRHATKQSERRAWMITGVACLITVGTVANAHFLTPEKENYLQVLSVGPTGVIGSVTTLDGDTVLTPTELQVMGAMAGFVSDYESYNFYDLNEPYKNVGAMASPEVAKPYAALYNGKNARQTDPDWMDKVTIEIAVLHTVPHKETATVRFERKITIEGRPTTTTNHVATLVFGRHKHGKGTDIEILKRNPFGYQIEQYRVDNEKVAS